MEKQDFENLRKSLIEKGYKVYNQDLHYSDYILCKSFHRENNKWEKDRSAYQIILCIYDYTTKPGYWDRLPESSKNYVGIQIEIGVSRTINERIDLSLNWEEDTEVEDIEKKAESFYKWVCETYPEPRID